MSAVTLLVSYYRFSFALRHASTRLQVALNTTSLAHVIESHLHGDGTAVNPYLTTISILHKTF